MNEPAQRWFFLAFLSFTLAPALRAEEAPARAPNVLFIVVDDLNDWVEPLGGHPQTLTPNLARLAARGVTFRNAHCAYALCNPSRASTLTGLLPSTSGVFGNQQDWRKARPLRERRTLPEYFRRRGYWTGAAGKVYHANHGGQTGALGGGHGGRQGFHHPTSWVERYPSKEVQIPDLVVRTGQNFNGLDIWHWDWGPINHPDPATADGRCVDWVIEQLKRKHTRPFFLALGVYAPHGPWYCPRSYFDMHPLKKVQLPAVKEDDLDDVPEVAKGYLRGKRPLHKLILEKHLYHEAVQAYLAQISFADATVGRVLDALDKSAYAKDTVVCLWSDHGWYLGEKQRWHKGGLWEEATRIPLIFAGPGVGKPGSACDRPVSLVDLYPTLVELCGLPPVEGLDGDSLVPLLKDPTSARTKPALTISGGGKRASYAVRTERWRYIRYHDGSEELYDHARDPNEWTNLAGREEHAGLKKELALWIPKKFADAGLKPFREQGPIDPRSISGEKLPFQVGIGSTLLVFADGDMLDQEDSPDLSGRTWGVGAKVTPTYPDGVLASQGGASSGWALYLLDGKLAMTIRHRGKATTIASYRRPPRTFTAKAEVGRDGAVALFVDGKTVATGRLPGPLRKLNQGLSVGHPSAVLNNDIRVGPFRGKMESLFLKIGPKGPPPDKGDPKKP
jgi:arylsulfatase A-like enzyme